MDWLKEILNKVGLKDNKLDIDTVIEGISKEISNNFIVKSEYDNVNSKLYAANTTIKSFEGSISKEDIEALKAEHKTQLSSLEENTKEMDEKELNYELDKFLNSTNCKDNNDIRALLNMEGIKYQAGKFEGLEEQIKDLKTNKDYLFKELNADQDIKNPYYKIIDGSGAPSDSDSIVSQISNAISGNI